MTSKARSNSVAAGNSGELIFRCDFTPHFTYVSPASLRLLGRAPEEFVGRPPSVAVFAGDLRVVGEHIRKLRTSGPKTSSVQVRFVHRDGSLVWMEVSARTVVDPATGEPKEMVLVARDIT
jgi:PAS domain S-box-containing protein